MKSLILILTVTSLLNTTTLAIPTLHPRDGGIAGADTRISIMLDPTTNCAGTPTLSTELLYDTQYARQFKSYSLSHDLDDQTITLYADKDWKLNFPAGSMLVMMGMRRRVV